MASFQAPPYSIPPVTALPDGTIQISQPWNSWFISLSSLLGKGVTTTVPLAKLTGGGADGQLVITNGVITSAIPPT